MDDIRCRTKKSNQTTVYSCHYFQCSCPTVAPSKCRQIVLPSQGLSNVTPFFSQCLRLGYILACSFLPPSHSLKSNHKMFIIIPDDARQHIITQHTNILSKSNPHFRSRFRFNKWSVLRCLLMETATAPDAKWERTIMTPHGWRTRM